MGGKSAGAVSKVKDNGGSGRKSYILIEINKYGVIHEIDENWGRRKFQLC